MQEPTEQIVWIVIILLAIAAIIANTLIPRLIGAPVGTFVVIIFMALLAICGVLALRHKWRD